MPLRPPHVMHRGFKRRSPHTDWGSSFSFDEPQVEHSCPVVGDRKQSTLTESRHVGHVGRETLKSQRWPLSVKVDYFRLARYSSESLL